MRRKVFKANGFKVSFIPCENDLAIKCGAGDRI